MDFDAFIELVKEQQGIDLSEVLTTADQIDRPERAMEKQAIIDFENRNPMAGGGMLVQPGFGGTRQGYAKEKNIGANQYGTFKTDKKTGFQSINEQRLNEYNKKNKFINKLISNANSKDKYVSIGEIAEKVKKKFKLKNAKSINITSFPDLELLESRADKIDKVLKDMLISDKPLNGFWHNVISERTGVPINKPGNLRYLNDVPTYQSIKDQGLDLLKVNYSRKSFNYLHNFSLSDQLSKALEIAKGNPTYIGLGGEKVRTALPSNKIMEFALRSWNTNKGSKDGPVQFFNKNGKPITWEKGIKLPYKNVSFSYNGKMHKKSDLNTDYMKKFFPEVYNNQIAINNLSVTKVDNPFKKPFKMDGVIYKPGNKIPAKILVKKIQVDNYKWSPRFPTLEILHGKKGVATEPFSNLTYATRDINQLENSINASLKAGNIKPAEANRLIKTVRSTISGKTGDDLREAIISRQLNLAKQKDLVFPRIKEMGVDEFKKALAPFGDGTCPVTFGKKGKRDGGRIGYQVGTTGFNKCVEQGVKNFNEGKFKTADQVQDAAKLLRGGRAVVSGLMKYGIVPELAYVGLEAAGRTILGEKPTNALLKSIDTLTFGATNFTSGIEADKFGKFSNQKLAVDKFRESQAKVNSLQSKLKNLEGISDQGGEGYVGDLTSDIQMTQAQLQAAKQELQKNTVSSDIVQFIDRKAEEIADAQMAKSPFAKQSLKDQMDGIPTVADYTETEPGRMFPKQPSQTELNLDLLPTMPTDFLQEKTSDLLQRSQDLRDQGYNISTKDLIEYQDKLKSMPLSEFATMYNPEQVYGAQGTFFGEPLAKGGRAGFSKGSLRKGVLSLIDKSIKSTPKDTTTQLDKLIKKTLDEDFFDKKDRIIDNINLKIARARAKGLDSQEIGEGQIEFYDDITKSNFKTKTGPFFDRRKKAGGGILKQAGDSSGPPPESGPNPQGLQGLMKRGIKT